MSDQTTKRIGLVSGVEILVLWMQMVAEAELDHLNPLHIAIPISGGRWAEMMAGCLETRFSSHQRP